MRFGKWDNASTHLMGEVLVDIADRAPERDVLLLALGNDPSLLAVTCNASNWCAPSAVYRLTTTNERGGQDRTFNRLDGTHC